MASRIILSTFTRSLRFAYIPRHGKCFTSPPAFKMQANLLHMKTFDKDLRPVESDNLSKKPIATRKSTEEFVSSNPDVFGNANITNTPPDPGDVQEDEFIQNPTRVWKKKRTKEYAALIKEHLNNHRLKEAIDVLEVKMLKEDRVKPESYIYNLLISGCAKAGYSRKAFQLFNKMKQRNLKVKGGTYTSLFNACANAPSIADGLSKANHLREIMLEKGYAPNAVNYNAMIKAYGRCGDTKTAYLLADEMLDKNLKVNSDTFNFLLQACASDKRYGFRHALLTWHRMHKNRIAPDYYSFNLMLRCVRDTSIGDVETMEGVLKHILDSSQEMGAIAGPDQIQIAASGDKAENTQQLGQNMNDQVTSQAVNTEAGEQNANDQVKNPFNRETNVASTQAEGEACNKSQIAITQSNRNPFEQRLAEISRPEFETPNLLSTRPHLGSLLSIKEVTTPHDRLLLLGGFSGFLQEMKKYSITPDIETFTAMLEVIPPTYAAEKQLITMIRKIGLKADIDFFNILIKKRSMRFDYDGAKEVLSMIQTAGLFPDIVTYGVLALGCQTQESARELIAEMRSKNIRMNIQILGAMLRQGCATKTFPYVTEILQISLDENIRPNEVFLRHLDNFYKNCAKMIDSRHALTKTKTFKKEHAKFCSKYRTWQEEQGISQLKLQDAIKKVKERPYQQFSEGSVEGMEDEKNVKLAKKTKRRKYIKKIKVNQLRGDDDNQDIKQIASPSVAPTKSIE